MPQKNIFRSSAWIRTLSALRRSQHLLECPEKRYWKRRIPYIDDDALFTTSRVQDLNPIAAKSVGDTMVRRRGGLRIVLLIFCTLTWTETTTDGVNGLTGRAGRNVREILKSPGLLSSSAGCQPAVSSLVGHCATNLATNASKLALRFMWLPHKTTEELQWRVVLNSIPSFSAETMSRL